MTACRLGMKYSYLGTGVAQGRGGYMGEKSQREKSNYELAVCIAGSTGTTAFSSRMGFRLYTYVETV